MSLLTTQVSDGGRIVIPIEIRKKMNIKSGDQLLLSYHDGELHVATKKQRIKHAQDLVSNYAGNRSLSKALIQERRQENEL